MVTELVALFVGTFVSEDLACTAAGALSAHGELPIIAATAACAAGIYVGDLGLWLVGRLLGGRVLARPRVRGVLPMARTEQFADWFDEHAAVTILGSRFAPGTRLPLYLAAGAAGSSFAVFARWTLLAVGIWAPLLVLTTAFIGEQVRIRIGGWFTWSAYVAGAGVIAVLILCRIVRRFWSRRVRQYATATISRIWRWEFWPMWLFYAPVGIWIVGLAIRYGGFRTITAANPGIADGGVVGESKFDILQRLPREWTIPSILLNEGTLDARLQKLRTTSEMEGWSAAVVLKPDTGQRGTGVRLVTTSEEATEYLTHMTAPVVAQPYHPGPFEAGVFYYRRPHWTTGKILAITDKHFPAVVGDGRASLEDLIWAHERYRMQARTFLTRLGARRREVPARGMRVRLGIAGNHAQGAMFTDGSWMWTAALEARIDAIARAYPGFFIGRFDVRYADREAFMAGHDLAIVELNGATAECTNIYDPAVGLLSAYRTLFRQWHLVFVIGAANRQNGRSASTTRRLLALVQSHLRASTPFPISD